MHADYEKNNFQNVLETPMRGIYILIISPKFLSKFFHKNMGPIIW